MKQLLLNLVAGIVTALIPVYAYADYSESAQSAGGQMRIASLPINEQGEIEALLQIDLKDGWITYWREPGASGIPPQITTSDASIAAISNMRYPVPKQIILAGALDIAYDEPVALPFTVKLNQPDQTTPIKLSVLIGICKDICIPFSQEFTIDPQAGAKRIEISQAMSEALSKLPRQPRQDFKLESFALAPDKKSLDLKIKLPSGVTKLDEVIVAGPPGHAYTKINSQALNGDVLELNLDAISLPSDYATKGQVWEALLRTGTDTIETELKFE